MDFHQGIYLQLKKTAKDQTVITYSEVALLAGLDMGSQADRTELGRILGTISEREFTNGRPLLSVVAVLKETNTPSEGFYKLARELGVYEGKDNDLFFIRELAKVHEYWKHQPLP